MLKYELGEMKSDGGSVLAYEVEAKATEYAICISHIIELSHIYKELVKKLPSQRVLPFFQLAIRQEIYPFVRQGCVIQWYKNNDKTISSKESVIRIPNKGIFVLLKECWNLKNVPIKFVNPILFYITRRALLYQLIKKNVKQYLVSIINNINKFKKYRMPLRAMQGGTIACHYGEGIDPLRRNDLHWYPGSGVRPEKVLIYFDSVDYITKRPVVEEVILDIEKRGFRWVALRKGIIKGYHSNYWQAHNLSRDLYIRRDIAKNTIQKWIVNISNNLLRQVYYWRAFYNDFNIRINYVPEEACAKNIAQAIAFDIEKEKQGVLVGKQRSENIFPPLSFVAYHPKHVFFIWNRRTKDYLILNNEKIETLIVTGYPNIISRESSVANANFSQRLRAKGADFIIVLFDNAYGPQAHFSENSMAKVYQAMLQLVINDSTIGLIIKSKKPHVINNLLLIQPLLKKAVATGRCIRVRDEAGWLPSSVYLGADLAIGCGISSAVTETVINGGKGIHYDMTCFRNHEFYQWGYEKIIFDDLENTLSAVKKYKAEQKNGSKLGDWSLYIDKLDPFRDGKGGERMGSYMRWILESFDKGSSRDDAIEYANRRYSKEWGEDKIINLRHANEKT